MTEAAPNYGYIKTIIAAYIGCFDSAPGSLGETFGGRDCPNLARNNGNGMTAYLLFFYLEIYGSMVAF